MDIDTAFFSLYSAWRDKRIMVAFGTHLWERGGTMARKAKGGAAKPDRARLGTTFELLRRVNEYAKARIMAAPV
jgi:hypothetical protein